MSIAEGASELTAEVAEVSAESAEEGLSSAFLCEVLGVLCVLSSFFVIHEKRNVDSPDPRCAAKRR